jgi:hypothetical protein
MMRTERPVRLAVAIPALVIALAGLTPAPGAAQTHWKVSTFNSANLDPATPGNRAAWCGEIYANTCGLGEASAGGYGHDWNETLHYTVQVPNSDQATVITLDMVVNYDVEPGHDFVRVVSFVEGSPEPRIAAEYTGTGVGTPVSLTINYSPGEYLGNGGDLARIAVTFESDGNWDDQDCAWPTVGAIQMDQVQVSITNGDHEESTFDDFEGGGLGNWTPAGVSVGSLGNPTVTPVACTTGDSVTWTVDWTHPDDLAPVQALAVIFDSSGFGDYLDMETSANSFLDGATYTFTQVMEEPGEYAYHFNFTNLDGSSSVLHDEGGQNFPGPTVTDPINAPPLVAEVGASPGSGPPGTTFELSALYSDAEGDCPFLAFVYVVNPVSGIETGYPLTGDGGDCTSGSWYSATVTLDDPGTYAHRYLFLNDADQIAYSPPDAADYHEDMVAVIDPTGVSPLLVSTRLEGAHPNPFNPGTTISWSLAMDGPAELVIYDVAGRRIKTLVSGTATAGPHDTRWDGRDDTGRQVASGVYHCRLQAGGFSETRQMVLLK